MVLVYRDALGITLNITCNFNLSGYSSVTLKITKPDGTSITVTPTVVSETLGTLRYATTTAFIVGTYLVQPTAVWPDGTTIPGEIDTFNIYERL